MKRDLSKFRRRLGLKLIGAAFILLGFAGMLQLMIRPNIMNVCEYNSRAVTVSLIDDAINERLNELGEDVGYSALVKLSYTADGRVSSIESNTKLINRIKNDMLTEINDRLMKGETENVDLTVGTLSGKMRKFTYKGRVIFSDILQTDAIVYPGNSGGPAH